MVTLAGSGQFKVAGRGTPGLALHRPLKCGGAALCIWRFASAESAHLGPETGVHVLSRTCPVPCRTVVGPRPVKSAAVKRWLQGQGLDVGFCTGGGCISP